MWHNGVIDGYWWEAKVYDNGSRFGIKGGRVSKLSVCEGDKWDHMKTVYNYSRGLDFDHAPVGLLDKILEYCEALPPSTEVE